MIQDGEQTVIPPYWKAVIRKLPGTAKDYIPKFYLPDGVGRIPRLNKELHMNYIFLRQTTPYRYQKFLNYMHAKRGPQDLFKACMLPILLHELHETSRKIEESLGEVIDLISELDAVAGSDSYLVPVQLVSWFGDIFHPERKVDTMSLAHLAEPESYLDEEYDLPDATDEQKKIYGRLAFFVNRIQYFSACDNEDKIKEMRESIASGCDCLSNQGIEAMPSRLRVEVDKVMDVQRRQRILNRLHAQDKKMRELQEEMEKLKKSSSELFQELKQLNEDELQKNVMLAKLQDEKNKEKSMHKESEEELLQKRKEEEEKMESIKATKKIAELDYCKVWGIDPGSDYSSDEMVTSHESDPELQGCKDKIKELDQKLQLARGTKDEKNCKEQGQVSKVELHEVGQKRERDVQLTNLEEEEELLKQQKIEWKLRTKGYDTSLNDGPDSSDARSPGDDEYGCLDDDYPYTNDSNAEANPQNDYPEEMLEDTHEDDSNDEDPGFYSTEESSEYTEGSSESEAAEDE